MHRQRSHPSGGSKSRCTLNTIVQELEYGNCDLGMCDVQPWAVSIQNRASHLMSELNFNTGQAVWRICTNPSD